MFASLSGDRELESIARSQGNKIGLAYCVGLSLLSIRAKVVNHEHVFNHGRRQITLSLECVVLPCDTTIEKMRLMHVLEEARVSLHHPPVGSCCMTGELAGDQ